MSVKIVFFMKYYQLFFHAKLFSFFNFFFRIRLEFDSRPRLFVEARGLMHVVEVDWWVGGSLVDCWSLSTGGWWIAGGSLWNGGLVDRCWFAGRGRLVDRWWIPADISICL